MRDPESSKSKNYGFVAFDNFDSSDQAIQQMNGQFFAGKPIDVSYSFKKEGMGAGERHGTESERVLAHAGLAQKPKFYHFAEDNGLKDKSHSEMRHHEQQAMAEAAAVQNPNVAGIKVQSYGMPPPPSMPPPPRMM